MTESRSISVDGSAIVGIEGDMVSACQHDRKRWKLLREVVQV